MKSNHPSDMEILHFAFAGKDTEPSPELVNHVLLCPECRETMLTMRELQQEGVLDSEVEEESGDSDRLPLLPFISMEDAGLIYPAAAALDDLTELPAASVPRPDLTDAMGDLL